MKKTLHIAHGFKNGAFCEDYILGIHDTEEACEEDILRDRQHLTAIERTHHEHYIESIELDLEPGETIAEAYDRYIKEAY